MISTGAILLPGLLVSALSARVPLPMVTLLLLSIAIERFGTTESSAYRV